MKAATVSYFSSTVGAKQIMGVAGFAFALFLFTHMAANMLILFDAKAYNMYSHALISNPLIYIAEAGLVLFFLVHAIKGSLISIKNLKSRDTRYAKFPSGPKGTNWVMRSMWIQGLIILAFVILHLITFKYGTHYDVNYEGVQVRDLHRLVLEVFQSPVYVAWYAVCMVLIGMHLSHGMYSVFQTVGVRHPKYTPMIKCGAWIYALVVAGGFISQPIYVYFIHKG